MGPCVRRDDSGGRPQGRRRRALAGAASNHAKSLSTYKCCCSGSAIIHLGAFKICRHHSLCKMGDVMERRHFLKVAIGFAAGAAAVAASASAAPLSPYPLNQQLPAANEAQPANAQNKTPRERGFVIT